MKLFSRWMKKKENLARLAARQVKREEQRQAAKEPVDKTQKKEDIETPAVKPKVKPSEAAYRLLLKPLVTEKSTYLESEGQYCFVVHPRANKIEVKKAVENAYGVKVAKVRIINCQGKKVRYGRLAGTRKDWKKAIVTLKAGEKIGLRGNV